jgi:hypothetical protein
MSLKFNFYTQALIMLGLLSIHQQTHCQTANFHDSSQILYNEPDHNDQKQNDAFLYRRSVTGNIIGTLMGGLLGAGITRISGIADDEVIDGTPMDIDKALLGFYIGGVFGSTLGSAVFLKSNDTKGFGKILLRSFIPHLIFSGTGLLLASSTESSDGLILGSAFIIAWLLTPGQAVKAYKDYNSVNALSQKNYERVGFLTLHPLSRRKMLFSVRIN